MLKIVVLAPIPMVSDRAGGEFWFAIVFVVTLL